MIGYIAARPQAAQAPLDVAFRRGLAEAGYAEGRNVAIEPRTIEGRYDALDEVMAEFVRLRTAVIFAGGGPQPVRAAMAATSTIPIIFTSGSDPVADGLVVSFNRPGGNVTGIYMMVAALAQKLVELLHELVPAAAVVAVLVNPSFAPTKTIVKQFEEAARLLNLKLVMWPAQTAAEIDAVFTNSDQRKADALLVSPEPFLNGRNQQIAALAAHYRIPAIYGAVDAFSAGGLIAYGSDFADAYREAGRYAGKILGGARPADLPVVQASRFKLAINLKTAKALGIAIPPTLLARADEVIE